MPSCLVYRVCNNVEILIVTAKYEVSYDIAIVDPGGLGVIILASGSEDREFDPGDSERKNPEYDFLRKGSKAVGPVS